MVARYQVGDVLQFKNSTVVRLITEVTRRGYVMLANTYPPMRCSDDTPDPLMEDGWKKIDNLEGVTEMERLSALNRYNFPIHNGVDPWDGSMTDEEVGRLSADKISATRAAAEVRKEVFVFPDRPVIPQTPLVFDDRELLVAAAGDRSDSWADCIFTPVDVMERMVEVADSVVAGRVSRKSGQDD